MEEHPLGKVQMVMVLQKARKPTRHVLERTTEKSRKEPRQVDPMNLEEPERRSVRQVDIRRDNKNVWVNGKATVRGANYYFGGRYTWWRQGHRLGSTKFS